MVKTFEAETQLFIDVNIPLLAEHDPLSETYGRLVGSLKVRIEGEELSYSEVTPRLEDKDRNVREKAWRARWQSLLKAADEFDTLYLDLLKLRWQIAHNAGLDSYLQYRWLELGRFDYEPEDNVILAEAIEAEVLPLLAELRDRRKTHLSLNELRPWDVLVYPFEEEVQTPFNDAQDLLQKSCQLLREISPDLVSLLATMEAGGTLDMELRENKLLTDIGDYDYIRGLPVIYTYCTGGVYDLTYFFHEFGHAYHFDLSMTQPLYWQQWGRLEVMELAAQTMELLKLPHLGVLFPKEEIEKLKFLTFEKILSDLTLVPVLDLFQQWVYKQPPEQLSPEMLDDKYAELVDRFMPGLDWGGLEAEKRKGWYYKHLFQYPLYFVEYGYAWVGALDVYGNYLSQPQKTLGSFKGALSLGKSQSISSIYAEAGTHSPARRDDIKSMVSIIRNELAVL